VPEGKGEFFFINSKDLCADGASVGEGIGVGVGKAKGRSDPNANIETAINPL